MGLAALFKMKTTHLIFDTETLGKCPNAVVLSVACIPFTFEDNKSFQDLARSGKTFKLSVQEQLQKGRKTDNDTLDWWKKQGPNAKEILKPSNQDLSMNQFCRDLTNFIGKETTYEFRRGWVWSRGNLFDFGKLESIFNSCQSDVPWNNFMQRDIRTMVDMLCGTDNGRIEPTSNRDGFIPHNALHDAANDARTMIEIYNTLKDGA